MKGIRFIPDNTSFDFVSFRFIAYGITALLVVGSIILTLTKGLNFGIDFRGGYLVEARFEQPADIAGLRHKLNQLKVGEVKLQSLENPRDVLIRIERSKGADPDEHTLTQVKSALGDKVSYRRIETVGPKVSGDLVNGAIWSVMWAMLAMLIYIWFRFEWQFSVCGIFALLHDCVGVIGFYALTQLEFNETAIIAILTTAGYSINDTVVIYDRIRENLRKQKVFDLKNIINKSINETLSRTILTSGTTLIALFALYLFGGEVIANFSLPIIVGISMGAFSSICVAALLLLFFDLTPKITTDPENPNARTA